MRKQLMTGVAAAAICLGLASCSRFDYTLISEGEQAYVNYENAFIEKFGEPAPDQTWGFGSADANNGGAAQGAITRSANTNSNQWFDENQMNYKKPADITEAEITYVIDWFKTHTKADGQTLDINNYFIQQIGYSGDSYSVTDNNGESSNIESSKHMDYIFANLDANGSSKDHVNNFNTSSGSIMLMENSETKYGFGFHDSWGTDDTDVTQNYLMAEIDVPGVGKGWYVGLDYQTKKSGAGIDLKPDGKYDDRVMKIVPAKKNPTKGDIRIIAEDLSASEGSDFDFNDVVFDVKYGYPQWDKTTIILQAAGGKLPLCIGQIDEAYEVHNLFRVSLNTMVNTEDWTAHKDPVTFVIDGQYGSWNIKDLPIYVKKGNDWCELKAEQGKAASKIGVPTTFKWVKELKDIEPIYTKFKEYVSNPSIEWWNTISDKSQIYNAQ